MNVNLDYAPVLETHDRIANRIQIRGKFFLVEWFHVRFGALQTKQKLRAITEFENGIFVEQRKIYRRSRFNDFGSLFLGVILAFFESVFHSLEYVIKPRAAAVHNARFGKDR